MITKFSCETPSKILKKKRIISYFLKINYDYTLLRTLLNNISDTINKNDKTL